MGEADGSVIEMARRDLLEAWRVSGEGWQDSARAEIEREHLDPLLDLAREAAATVQQLSLLLADAERACQ